MGKARGNDWLLCLDESGDFSDQSEPVAIAGVLLQEADAPLTERELRRQIEGLDPIVPYPIHATDVRIGAFHVAAWRLAGSGQQRAHPENATLSAANRRFDRGAAAADSAARAFVDEVSAGRLPRRRRLREADAWLATVDPPLHRALAGLGHETLRRFRSLLLAVARAYGPDRCFAVGAFEGPTPAVDGGDRYLALLVVLLERVLALLRARPPEQHRVWVLAAERDVQVGLPRPRTLMAQDLGRCVRQAERFPLDPPAGPTDPHVRLIPRVPMAYDEAVHPGVVIADFVSNSLIRPLMGADDWGNLVAQAESRTALPIEAPPRILPTADRLPTIAASGAARRAITAAFAGETVDAPGRGWPREQAARWIALSTRLRGP